MFERSKWGSSWGYPKIDDCFLGKIPSFEMEIFGASKCATAPSCDLQDSSTMPWPSLGSATHALGICKPCDFQHRTSCRRSALVLWVFDMTLSLSIYIHNTYYIYILNIRTSCIYILYVSIICLYYMSILCVDFEFTHILYCIVLYCILLHYTISYLIISNHIRLYLIVYRVLLCHVILFYVIICCCLKICSPCKSWTSFSWSLAHPLIALQVCISSRYLGGRWWEHPCNFLLSVATPIERLMGLWVDVATCQGGIQMPVLPSLPSWWESPSQEAKAGAPVGCLTQRETSVGKIVSRIIFADQALSGSTKTCDILQDPNMVTLRMILQDRAFLLQAAAKFCRRLEAAGEKVNGRGPKWDVWPIQI